MTLEEAREIEEHVVQLPIIKDLQETDKILYAELEKLEEGQKGIVEMVNVGFEKGRKRMSGMEDEMKALSTLITNFFARSEQMHQETKDALKDHKYQDIRDENKALKIKFQEDKKRKWDIVKLILATILGALVTFILTKLI